MSTNPMATHGAFSWVEYRGKNAAAARSYYEKVLGWTVAEIPMPEGAYTGIMLGEQPIGGFSPKSVESSGAWLAYVTVDDVDDRTRAAVEEGGKVISKPMEAPGVGRISVVEDPFGASVALISYENQNG